MSIRNPKNILVTGGAGFIGSAFIRYLFKLPEFQGNIINYDLLTYAGSTENVKGIATNRRYHFQQGDICDAKHLEMVVLEKEVDAIVHFAAESHVDRSIQSPLAFIDTNIKGTFSLLEIVRKFPHIHFHHISTDEVYGSLGESGVFTEHSPIRPNSPYAASKAASDHLVRAYANTYKLSTTISHCSNNYGPYQFPEKFIPLMILNSLQRKPLPVYGQGSNMREWLYVEDHARAVWSILTLGKAKETYDIGGTEQCRNIDLLHQLLDLIAEETGTGRAVLKDLIRYVQDRPGHDFRYAIEGTKLRNELGWKPQISLQEGLRKTVRWYLKNREWVQKSLDRLKGSEALSY